MDGLSGSMLGGENELGLQAARQMKTVTAGFLKMPRPQTPCSVSSRIETDLRVLFKDTSGKVKANNEASR